MSWKRNSLAHRLTFRVILFSSLIAICFTLLQLYLDFRQDVRNINAFFASIRETSLRPLEESVWILDDLQVSLQLEGLIKREDIVYAAVEMDGQVTWAKGHPVQNSGLSATFPLMHQVRGGQEEIGRLQVSASFEGIYQRLLRRVAILLIANTLKTFLVSGFILFLFRTHITSHLERFADYIQQIDLHQPPLAPLNLHRSFGVGDELDRMTGALNALCHSGHGAYRELLLQEQRLRLFLDATESAIFGVDAQGLCIFINQATCELCSVADAQTLLGCDLFAFLSQDAQGSVQTNPVVEQIRTTIEERRPLFADELELPRPEGGLVTVTLRSYPVIEHDQCTGAIVFCTDISRQQRLEEEKQLFGKIVRQAPALILITDSTGIIKFVNQGFEKVMGSAGENLVGQRALDCFPGLNLDAHLEAVRAKIHAAQTWVGSFSWIDANGRTVALDAAIFPIHDRQGRLTNVVAMGRDTSREQQLLAQLHHAQKMEAMGKLAASIAHEFGNPLLGIRFALRDVQQRPGLSEEDSRLLALAESECDRMRKLIRDLQQFNRPSSGRRTDFDPHRVLDEILALHHNLLAKKQIRTVFDYTRQPVRLHAVEDQIRQVFINLIINASDAMTAGGGTLTLSTRIEAGLLLMEVRDSGAGIAQEHLDRIFEPFFTTKSSVEGTGLGLPVSYGIVRAHGGSIAVDSHPENTVFTVRLPLRQVDGNGMSA